MRYTFFFLLFIIFLSSQAQKRSELGANFGIMFYNGDLNESRLLNSLSINSGILYKYNFNERYSIRFGGSYGKLRSIAPNGSDIGQILGKTSFESNLLDVALQPEFNFLAYNPYEKGKEDFITPYVTAGLGVFFFNGFKPSVSIPFGFGLKVKITQRIGIQGEWTFRKTFTDQIDGVENITRPGHWVSWIHNCDWYSICGIVLTFNISNIIISCPAYEEKRYGKQK